MRRKSNADLPTVLPTFTSSPDQVSAFFPALDHEEPEGQHICVICDIGTIPMHERECWGCDAYVHTYCTLLSDPFASKGPWYCPSCTHHFRDTFDITLDAPLMRLIIDNDIPDVEHLAEKV